MLKYIANADHVNMINYMNQLIDQLNDDITHDQLSKLDKFCVLLTCRIMCIGPEIELDMTCEKSQQKYKGSIVLTNILQMMSDLDADYSDDIVVNDNIVIHTGMPGSLYYPESSNIFDVLSDSIVGVSVGDKHFNTIDMSIQEKNNVINSIPGVNFNDIIKIADKTTQSFTDLIVFKDKSPHDDQSETKEYKLGLYDNSMYDMIKMCYTSNLHNHYMSMYMLCSTINFTADYVQNITPIESNIYIHQKQQEVERQNKAQQKQSQQPTVGQGLPMAI